MKEVFGDAWALANKFDCLCITTNGDIKNDGTLVMGKGIAGYCATKFPQIPSLLGNYVRQFGNRVFNLGKDEPTGIRLVSFPTKNSWRDNSDINLIQSSAIQLKDMADKNSWTKVLVPRPGVGCGQLQWKDVKAVLSRIFDDRFFVISDNPNDMPAPQASVPQPPVEQPKPQAPKENKKKILECSSKGDKRYSALCAKITMFGITDTIENFYQLSKRFGNDNAPDDWRYCKGKTPTHLIINNKKIDVKYLTPWYKLLWLVYLDQNPELVRHAMEFDDYNDIFKGKSVNCQADVIRQYIQVGRESLLSETRELIGILEVKEESAPPNFDTVMEDLDMNTVKLKTLCVTGHRPKDLWGYNSSAKYQQLQNKMYYCIKQFYTQFDVRVTKQGGAQGVDQLFGEVADYIRDNEFKDLITEVVVPFNGQERMWLDEGKFSKAEYAIMLKRASKVTVVNPNLNPDTAPKQEIGRALTERNTVMVNPSDYVLGIYKGDINNIQLTDNMHSGTLHALQTAYRQGKPIVVINPMTLVTTRINF